MTPLTVEERYQLFIDKWVESDEIEDYLRWDMKSFLCRKRLNKWSSDDIDGATQWLDEWRIPKYKEDI